MRLNMKPQQQRERAIQRAIQAAFKFNNFAYSTEILIAAISRMARTPGAGKPISADEASALAQQLYSALTY